MGGHHGFGINDGKTRHLCGFLLPIVDPVCWQAKRGVGGGRADQWRGDAAGIDRQEHAGEGLAFAHHHAAQRDAVAAGLEFEVVAHMHGGGQEAHFLRKLAAHALDAGEQVALAALVHQTDQAVAQLQAQQVHGLQVVPGGFAVGNRWRRGLDDGRHLLALVHHPGAISQQAAHGQEHHMRHARNQAQQDQDAGRDTQHAGRHEQLLHDLAAHVVVLAHAGDHHGGGHRDQQAGNLRHQRIANGQQDVAVGRLLGRQVVLQHANREAANDVDEQNQNTRHGVAAHELGGAVHGAEEVGFFRHFSAAALGFLFVDQAGVQVGIHRHLFAGHGVQREAGRHFGNALRTLGDHHEVDHHEDRKHDQTNREVAADQEVAEGLDHCTGSTRPLVAFQQHHACGGHVQRQAHQGGQQQHRREGREVQGAQHVGCDHHHHQRNGDVEREEGIQQPRRDGQHHQRQNRHHQQGGRQALQGAGVGARPLLQRLYGGVHTAAPCTVVRFSGSSSGGTKGSTRLSGMRPSPRSAALRRYTYASTWATAV